MTHAPRFHAYTELDVIDRVIKLRHVDLDRPCGINTCGRGHVYVFTYDELADHDADVRADHERELDESR